MNKPLGQAGMPRGLIGRLLGRIMAQHNQPDNEWTIELLEIGSDERILEVGFGPGLAVESLVRAHPSASVVGIDHSATMLQAARSRNRSAIDTGNVHLELGSVADLPFPDATFEKAFSINCIYFWEEPVQGLGELHRVLKPEGRLAVTVRDKSRETYQAFRPDKLERMLRQAGFAAVEISSNGLPTHPLLCAIARK